MAFMVLYALPHTTVVSGQYLRSDPPAWNVCEATSKKKRRVRYLFLPSCVSVRDGLLSESTSGQSGLQRADYC